MTKDVTRPHRELIFLGPAAGTMHDLLWHTRGQLKHLQKQQEFLNKLEKNIAGDMPLQVLSVLDDIKRFLAENSAEVTETGVSPGQPQDWFVQESLRVIERVAQEAKRNLFLSYPKELERACKRAGLSLDKTSRHPIYTFDKGFFELRIRPKEKAILSNSERKCSEFFPDIAVAVEEVQKHHARVFDRVFDGESFLKKLRSEYLHVLQEEGLVDGAPVSLRQVARNMMASQESAESGTRGKRRPKGQQPDEFLVDLSRLINAGLLEIDGRRLELQQTDDSKQGMLLHDVPIPWYVGSVRFKEVLP